MCMILRCYNISVEFEDGSAHQETENIRRANMSGGNVLRVAVAGQVGGQRQMFVDGSCNV